MQGVFNRQCDKFPSPLEVHESKRRPSPEIQPHAAWAAFLAERVYLARFCQQEQRDLFELLFAQVLSLSIGSKDPSQKSSPMPNTRPSPMLSRHIEAVGVRFQLLTSALTLIQNDSSTHVQSENTLRQRIYSSAFDYFTIAPQVPTQSENHPN
ncbi:Phosphatidylinositol 4-kinase III alpha [Aphelenchoides bicaudatus]|nr:Phosphatidylinositol 4-kinase III alpha [Aphelenchoides bicaudatus]